MLTPLPGTGTAGSSFNPVVVVDKSDSVCSLDGRPAITLIGGLQGAASGPLATTTVLATGQAPVFLIAPTRVTLALGGGAGAGFLVQASDVPSNGQQSCPVVTSMKVTLPGISTSFGVAEKFSACGGPTIFVSAIVPASELPST